MGAYSACGSHDLDNISRGNRAQLASNPPNIVDKLSSDFRIIEIVHHVATVDVGVMSQERVVQSC